MWFGWFTAITSAQEFTRGQRILGVGHAKLTSWGSRAKLGPPVLFGPGKRAARTSEAVRLGSRVCPAGKEQGGETECREDRADDEGGRGANLLPQETGDQARQQQGYAGALGLTRAP